jgi:hypothetical protein
MEAMQVYHLTIRENGHSRRFVYEDHDEALAHLAAAIAAGLDAKLDEVVRAPALPKPTGSDRRAVGTPVWKRASRAGPVRDASLAGEHGFRPVSTTWGGTGPAR